MTAISVESRGQPYHPASGGDSGPGPSPSSFECLTSPFTTPYTQPSGLDPVPLAGPKGTVVEQTHAHVVCDGWWGCY
jgi:hypothetical protein